MTTDELSESEPNIGNVEVSWSVHDLTGKTRRKKVKSVYPIPGNFIIYV